MVDKLTCHKRPSLTFRYSIRRHLAAPATKHLPRKKLRPLSDEERQNIAELSNDGKPCQEIASELGIPFVLVHRYLGGAS